jgi:signal recognition particle subunit SRP19
MRAEKKLLEMIAQQIQQSKTENVPEEPYTYPPAPVLPIAKAKQSKLKALPSAPGKGKSKAVTSTTASQPQQKRYNRPLPVPPEPRPSLTMRVSSFSPALPSGMLLDAVKASMNAPSEQGGLLGGPGGGAGAGGVGKGKRKVVRVRG